MRGPFLSALDAFSLAPYPNGSRFRALVYPWRYYAGKRQRTAAAENRLYGSVSSPNHPPPRGPAEPPRMHRLLGSRSRNTIVDLTYRRSPTSVWSSPVDRRPCHGPRRRGRQGRRRKSCATPPIATQASAPRPDVQRLPRTRRETRKTWRIGAGQSGAYALRAFRKHGSNRPQTPLRRSAPSRRLQWER